MRKRLSYSAIFLLLSFSVCAQNDSIDNERLSKMIVLSEVVAGKESFNVQTFINLVKKDTTFYKAFKNLHVLGFSAMNDIRMLDKKGNTKASLFSKTKQEVSKGCRSMTTQEQKVTGDMFDKKGNFNYYTAELYASLFFTNEPVCGENNIVGNAEFNPKDKSGMDKRKEQLKMLFFNPGKKIPGIPLMGDKSNVFDPDIAKYYDMNVDAGQLDGVNCYVFSVTAKSDLTASQRDKIVYDNMTTWFDENTYAIVGRNYSLSYNAGAYDFDVTLEVRLTKFGNLQVPSVLRYKGDWDIVFKKKERGMFTATLFDFRK